LRVHPSCGFSLCVQKSLKVFKKSMLSLDLVWLGLD